MNKTGVFDIIRGMRGTGEWLLPTKARMQTSVALWGAIQKGRRPTQSQSSEEYSSGGMAGPGLYTHRHLSNSA